jgi:biotin transport system substrate-specific component
MNNAISTKKIITTALMAALVCIIAPIAVPLPFTPVPISLSMLVIMFISLVLHPKYAFTAVLLYILLGAVGVPVFGGYTAGFAILAGPTGGYLFTMPIMAFLISIQAHGSHMAKLRLAPRFAMSLLACLSGLFAVYLGGTFWFMFTTGTDFIAALSLCVFPFVALDIAKAIFAILVYSLIEKRVRGLF